MFLFASSESPTISQWIRPPWLTVKRIGGSWLAVLRMVFIDMGADSEHLLCDVRSAKWFTNTAFSCEVEFLDETAIVADSALVIAKGVHYVKISALKRHAIISHGAFGITDCFLFRE